MHLTSNKKQRSNNGISAHLRAGLLDMRGFGKIFFRLPETPKCF